MVSMPSKNLWMRKQQCPCGDWKCFLSYEGETEEATIASQLGRTESRSTEPTISPYVGMVFKNDEDAFEYYKNFARKNGFSVRKERSRLSPQLGVYKRDFVCYRAGFAPMRKKSAGEHHRDRKSVRCGCDAKMYLSKEVMDGVSHQWCVVQFSNVHNHELLEDEQVRLLPAYRKIQEADQERIRLLSKAGFPIHRIVKVLESEKEIQGEQLPFLERDVRNFVQNHKKVVQENDALLTEKRESDTLDLLEACKAAKETDTYFVYDVSVDESNKVENIAWSYGDSVHAYNTFGDVVYFDTTYRSITYGMLFGVWLGIDNYGKVIFFGCALLQDEAPRSFNWALQAFLRFMKGRSPRTIITDIDPGIRDAIQREIPSTKHIISIWNILPKIPNWFSLPLGSRYAEFKSEFEVLYHLESVEDFECQWNEMTSRFGLNSDKHIALLFSLRVCWASAYTRGCFLAQMTSVSYAESVNAFLKEVFGKHTCLRSFFDQVAISSNYKTRTHDDWQEYTHLRTCSPMEEHARNVLTDFSFSRLQSEFISAMQYAASEMANGSYILRHFKKDDERLVIWAPEDEQIHCSCKEFETSGILCRHALRVLLMKNYFQLPEKYLLNRWRQEGSLLPYDNIRNGYGSGDWFQEFNALTTTLFSESSLTTERSNYVRQELTKQLTRLIDEVKSMPPSNGVVMDSSLSPVNM